MAGLVKAGAGGEIGFDARLSSAEAGRRGCSLVGTDAGLALTHRLVVNRAVAGAGGELGLPRRFDIGRPALGLARTGAGVAVPHDLVDIQGVGAAARRPV